MIFPEKDRVHNAINIEKGQKRKKGQAQESNPDYIDSTRSLLGHYQLVLTRLILLEFPRSKSSSIVYHAFYYGFLSITMSTQISMQLYTSIQMLDVHSTLRSIHVALYMLFLIHPLLNSYWIHTISTTKIIILYINSSILSSSSVISTLLY